MTVSASPSTRRLAVLLGALGMFGPFSIDAMFPAFPALEQHFRVNAAALQQIISVYLLGYAAMSLLHGALSDALGRRPVLLGNALVFLLASVGCALAATLPELLWWRLLQGLSAGAGFIVGRAVIRDVLEGAAAQKLMANVSMIFSLAPALAPIIGGWILSVGPWQHIFWGLAGFGALILVGVGTWLPETHPPARREPLDAGKLARNYLSMLRDGPFLILVAIITLNFAGLFLYISSAPAFVLDHLGLGIQQFGWFFGPVVGGMVAGSFVVTRVAGRMRSARIVAIGFTASLLGVLSNLAYVWFAVDFVFPWGVLPLVAVSFGVSIVFPELMVAILDRYPEQRGSASAMQAFLSLLFHAGVAGVLSPLVSGSPQALAMTAALLSISAWCLYRWRCPPLSH